MWQEMASTGHHQIASIEQSIIPEQQHFTSVGTEEASAETTTHESTSESSIKSTSPIEYPTYSNLPILDEIDLPYKLLRLGTFHGWDVSAESGEQWWGLFETEDGFELLPATIGVNTAYDALLDPEEGPFTGKEVTVNNSSNAILLLKGIEGLNAGFINTDFYYLQPNYELESLFDFTYYGISQDPEAGTNLRLTNEIAMIEQQLHNVLSFATDEIQQIFDTGSLSSLSSPMLIWAGDLDRDGKLDFLINNSTYNQSALTLFLSSAAEDSELVRPVARHIATGC